MNEMPDNPDLMDLVRLLMPIRPMKARAEASRKKSDTDERRKEL